MLSIIPELTPVGHHVNLYNPNRMVCEDVRAFIFDVKKTVKERGDGPDAYGLKHTIHVSQNIRRATDGDTWDEISLGISTGSGANAGSIRISGWHAADPEPEKD